MQIIETETTGPVTRVWVSVEGISDDTEESALSLAKASLGTSALADVVAHTEDNTFEVIFENALLDADRD